MSRTDHSVWFGTTERPTLRLPIGTFRNTGETGAARGHRIRGRCEAGKFRRGSRRRCRAYSCGSQGVPMYRDQLTESAVTQDNDLDRAPAANQEQGLPPELQARLMTLGPG